MPPRSHHPLCPGSVLYCTGLCCDYSPFSLSCVVYLFVVSRLRLHTMLRVAFYVRLLPILVSLPLLLLAVRRSLSHRISFVPDLPLVL
ncbi:hypothetical protein BGW80DRAFT_1348526, partial [Lactifluus volemus]